MNVNLKGEMHESKVRMSIPKNTDNRAVKGLFRMFVDLGEIGMMHLLDETNIR